MNVYNTKLYCIYVKLKLFIVKEINITHIYRYNKDNRYIYLDENRDIIKRNLRFEFVVRKKGYMRLLNGILFTVKYSDVIPKYLYDNKKGEVLFEFRCPSRTEGRITRLYKITNGLYEMATTYDGIETYFAHWEF